VTELRFLQLVAGENKTTFLLNLVLPCFENRGDACFNAIANRIGFAAFRGAPLAFEIFYFDDTRIV
jgi:hypothetical protein